MKKNILVTGGGGYIGSHLILQLEDSGYHPIVFDNDSRSSGLKYPDIDYFSGDLRSLSDLKDCFLKQELHAVVHLASLAYVGESVSEPILYYENNLVGSINLIKTMKNFGLNNIVFSSSCATYGNDVSASFREDAIQSPINPYGRTKLYVEQILLDCGRAFDLNSICLRYFNAAGSDPLLRTGELHEPETHLIPLILLEALRTKNGGDANKTGLEIYGNDFLTEDGTAIRDFVHVVDICSAHTLALDRLFRSQSLGTEFYNLSNMIGFSVLEVIEACRVVTSQPIHYKISNRREGDPAILVGDSCLARNQLGWLPKYSKLNLMIEHAWDFLLRTNS
jgi:UDP-glucose-4-epimerase GalE